MKSPLKALFTVLTFALSLDAFAQAPVISYGSGTVTITPGVPISLTPTNTGGAVPLNQYVQVSTFAGSNSGLSGTVGYVNGTGTAALFNNPQGMAVDAANNLYVADAGNNAIRKISPTGVVTTFAGSLTGVAGFTNATGTAALFNSPVGLTFDAYGNLMVADYNNSAIREISPAGVVTTFYQGTPGRFAPKRLCYDNLALLWVSMDGGQLVANITPAGVLGTYFLAYQIMTDPIGIGTDALGFLYIADGERNEIFRYNIIDVLQESVIGGDSSATTFQLNGVGGAATFTNPSGIQVMPDGTVYIADLKNNDIRKITPGDTVSLFAGVVPLNGSGFPTQQPGYVDGAPATAQFNQPCDVRADNNGNLFVSEWGAGGNRIRKITQTGYTLTGTPLPTGLILNNATGVISGSAIYPVTTAQTDTITALNASGSSMAIIMLTPGTPLAAPNISYAAATVIAGTPVTLTPINNGGAVPAAAYGTVTTFAGSVAGNIPGTGTNATLNWPQSMVMDKAGNLYVAVAYNNAIEKITPAGVVSDFAGNINEYSGFQNGTGKLTYFNYPDGLAMDTAGNMYVADYKNNAIRKVTLGAVVTTFYASTGTFGPGGMSFDNSGNLIVSAQDANQVWKITPAGVASVVAGTTIAGNVNGPAGSAQFSSPSDIQVDTAGNIYVADYQNNAVRKITPGGQVSTIAGSTVSGAAPGYANGPGTEARFNGSAGIFRAAGGVIYVTDFYNNSIRRIMPDGTVGLVAGSATQVAGETDGVGTAAGFDAPCYLFIDGAGMGYVAEVALSKIRQIVLTGYSLTGTLPAGLAFNPASGVISGTPTAPVISQVDTITAYNTAGISTTIITLPASNIASLANLVPGSGTLSPVFATGSTSYTDSVANSTTGITLTPTATNSAATITVNGTAVPSGIASGVIPLATGTNTITTVVTAQDGITTDTYTVTVTRAAGSVATLTNLTLSQGTLAPAFTTATTAYTAAVPNSVNSIMVIPTATDSTATITVNGIVITSGTGSAAIPLKVGYNTVTTIVTAQNGTTTDTYRVIVTRPPSSVATLTNLTVSQGTLTPAFAPVTIAYVDSVANFVTSITVTPTLTDSTATIAVNGTAVSSGAASQVIPLNPGNNTATVVITAQDSVTTDTYTITIFVGNTTSNLDATNVLTPNGDGKNDYWLIKNIALYPQNNVTVFDKGGSVVFTKRGYNNDWDGTLNGSPLLQGTYYYVVALGPNLPIFKGFISIVRN